MWSNYYIQLAVIFAVGIILCIVNRHGFYEQWGFIVTVTIPCVGLLATVYLGFYRFWKKVK